MKQKMIISTLQISLNSWVQETVIGKINCLKCKVKEIMKTYRIIYFGSLLFIYLPFIHLFIYSCFFFSLLSFRPSKIQVSCNSPFKSLLITTTSLSPSHVHSTFSFSQQSHFLLYSFSLLFLTLQLSSSIHCSWTFVYLLSTSAISLCPYVPILL